MYRASNNPARIRDDHTPLVLVRDAVTSNTDTINLDPAQFTEGATTIVPVPVNDWPNVGLRWAADGSDGGTFVMTIVGWYERQTTQQSDTIYRVPPGDILYQATLTLGTETESNRHPITGVAWTGAIWRYPDTITASTADAATDGAGCNVKLYNASGNNRRAWMTFDPSNRSNFYVFCTTFSNVTTVTVGAFGVG